MDVNLDDSDIIVTASLVSDDPSNSDKIATMAASDDDTRSEVSEILASCETTSPKKKDGDQNSETSTDPFEVFKI